MAIAVETLMKIGRVLRLVQEKPPRQGRRESVQFRSLVNNCSGTDSVARGVRWCTGGYYRTGDIVQGEGCVQMYTHARRRSKNGTRG